MEERNNPCGTIRPRNQMEIPVCQGRCTKIGDNSVEWIYRQAGPFIHLADMGK